MSLTHTITALQAEIAKSEKARQHNLETLGLMRGSMQAWYDAQIAAFNDLEARIESGAKASRDALIAVIGEDDAMKMAAE